MLTTATDFTYETLNEKRPSTYPIAFDATDIKTTTTWGFGRDSNRYTVYQIPAVGYRNGPNRSTKEFVIGTFEYTEKDLEAPARSFLEILDLATPGTTKLHCNVILHPAKIWIGGWRPNRFRRPGNTRINLGEIDTVSAALELFNIAADGERLPEPWSEWYTFA